MSKTYEEAVREKQEETEEGEEHLIGFPNYARETDPDIDVESLEEAFEEIEDISVDVPDWLVEEGVFEGDVPQRRDPNLPIPTPGVDLNLSALDNQGLLEIIARVNIAQMAALFDIADAVEPFSNITVSGVNAIDDANVPQPVIPQSDEQNIPTRVIFIRADLNNNKPIAFGDDEVDPASGFVLQRGEYINLELDFREDQLWMASEEEGEQVQLLGMV